MMNNRFIACGKPLRLDRWPPKQHARSLQAWDSADEYLIQHIEQQNILTTNTKLTLINDQFGCLSCYFHDLQPVIQVDSYLSMQAIQYNLKQNNLSANGLVMLPSTISIPSDTQVILLKIPKKNGYLASILSDIASNCATNTRIIAAAKVRDIHQSTLQLFTHYLGKTQTSLAQKKSRLIFSSLTNKAQAAPYPRYWKIPNSTITVTNHANVFSSESLDIGTRFLLEHLPRCTDKTVIDLGCGNGVLGATILQHERPRQMIFVDESYMAVQSAQQTITANFQSQEPLCQFIVDDCLSKQTDQSADIILCNPPFHQQHTITGHIARQMFNDAHRVLKPHGVLRIVANRHLGYHTQLKHLFGNYSVVANNRKFVVLQTQKGNI